MKKRALTFVLLAAAVLVATTLASASGVTCRNGPGCLNGSAHFDWTLSYGPPFSPIPNNSLALLSTGVAFAQVNFGQGGDGERVDQGNGWNGNFRRGDELLWTNSPGQGPLTLTFFGFGVTGVGANIQTDFFGPFTALIQGFGPSGDLIDSFSESGNSNPDGDGSAIFIGLQGLVDYSSVTFSITSCMADCNDFAINQLDINPAHTDLIPEPASLFLFGTGLLGLGGGRRLFSRQRVRS